MIWSWNGNEFNSLMVNRCQDAEWKWCLFWWWAERGESHLNSRDQYQPRAGLRWHLKVTEIDFKDLAMEFLNKANAKYHIGYSITFLMAGKCVFKFSFYPISALHSDSKYLEIGMLVTGHSLIHSLVCSHRSFVRLLRTARFARALCCAHSFARSLTHSLVGQWIIFVQFS